MADSVASQPWELNAALIMLIISVLFNFLIGRRSSSTECMKSLVLEAKKVNGWLESKGCDMHAMLSQVNGRVAKIAELSSEQLDAQHEFNRDARQRHAAMLNALIAKQ